MPPTAIVMNMFYTGLGIARSLGEHGIPVIGLSAQRGIYGNFTRYAKIVRCPDSRHEPEALLAYLLQLGERIGSRSVIFPTRDDDVIFLDRFRAKLADYFITTIPESPVVEICLDKWATYLAAQKAGVPAPKCWLIEGEQELTRALPEIAFPCVLKPVTSQDWRMGKNWQVVGGRKAIGISSRQELLAEYAVIASAERRALIQEMVPGGDECLLIAACYLDRQSNFVAGFNTQKLIQSPEGFGTGCIVQAAHRPELFEPAIRLLRSIHFTGIAEVEYKWDAADRRYKLIEINPRPWDQHRIGKYCGTDLTYLAYCEHASLPTPATVPQTSNVKWVAEDTFITTALRLLRGRDGKFRKLFAAARGKRIYAIWTARDPLPLLAYFTGRFIPQLIGLGARIFGRTLGQSIFRKRSRKEGLAFENHLEKGKSSG